MKIEKYNICIAGCALISPDCSLSAMLVGVLGALLLAECGVRAQLGVYGPVPGLAPSPYYALLVRELGAAEWRETFMLLTECTAEKETHI